MKLVPYYIGAIALLSWVVAITQYNAGPIAHILLMISLIAAFWVGVIQWKT